MRAVLFLIFSIFICTITCNAQDLPKNIKWSFAIEKTEKANEYLIKAKGELKPNWHIFDLNPGGDGFLIAPEFSFSNPAIKQLHNEAKGQIITNEFPGVDGKVRYYENEVSFNVLIRSKENEINGSIYYQICDHEKCLAPTEEPFYFKLNK